MGAFPRVPARRREAECTDGERAHARLQERGEQPVVVFAVLGPIEVRVDGETVALGGPKQRALLALLLLNANDVVSRDRLLDAVWGERAPVGAQRSLDSYIWRLRTLLGGDRIERRAPG